MRYRASLLLLLAALAAVVPAAPSRAATFTGVKIQNGEGHATITRKGRESRINFLNDNVLNKEDRIKAEDDAVIDLLFHDFAGVEIVGEHELTVISTELSQTQLFFKKGAMIFNIRLLPPGATLLFETDTALVRPEKGQFYISAEGKATTVCTFKGEVFFTDKDSGSSLKVPEGFCVDVAGDDSIAQVRPATDEDMDTFKDVNTIPTSP